MQLWTRRGKQCIWGFADRQPWHLGTARVLTAITNDSSEKEMEEVSTDISLTAQGAFWQGQILKGQTQVLLIKLADDTRLRETDGAGYVGWQDSKESQQARMMGQSYKEESSKTSFWGLGLGYKRTAPPEDKGYMVSKHKKFWLK